MPTALNAIQNDAPFTSHITSAQKNTIADRRGSRRTLSPEPNERRNPRPVLEQLRCQSANDGLGHPDESLRVHRDHDEHDERDQGNGGADEQQLVDRPAKRHGVRGE
jgi:hypothetical protein